MLKTRHKTVWLKSLQLAFSVTNCWLARRISHTHVHNPYHVTHTLKIYLSRRTQSLHAVIHFTDGDRMLEERLKVRERNGWYSPCCCMRQVVHSVLQYWVWVCCLNDHRDPFPDPCLFHHDPWKSCLCHDPLRSCSHLAHGYHHAEHTWKQNCTCGSREKRTKLVFDTKASPSSSSGSIVSWWWSLNWTTTHCKKLFVC